MADASGNSSPADSISFNFTLNDAEVQSVLNMYWHKRIPRLALPMAALVLGYALNTGFSVTGLLAGAFMVAAVLPIVIFVWNRSALNKPRQEINVHVSPSGVTSTSWTEQAHHAWSEYKSITDNGFLVVLTRSSSVGLTKWSSGGSTVIPSRVVSNEDYNLLNAMADRFITHDARVSSQPGESSE